MGANELYTNREQTLVKHFILQRYLERFAHIVGARWDVITYIDCFSGPWNVKSQALKDSSFCIALEELRKAKATHEAKGRKLRLRCFFLEKDPKAYSKLENYAKSVEYAEVETRNSELESAIQDIVDFVKAGGSGSFPFIFIDPTGWTGFSMESIAPLLKLDPGEVLINFMTGHVRRFIDSPQEQTQESFIRLFGSADFKSKVQGLEKQDREEAVVKEYSEIVKRTGSFKHIGAAIVLHPEIDRTHFHLIYATRNAKGLEVFKDAEKKAMLVMEEARAEAHKRKREARSQQSELFTGEVLHDPTYYNYLRDRSLAKARAMVVELLRKDRRVSYDDVWALALTVPLMWESDLKEWISTWVKEDSMRIEGLKPRQRVPQRKQNIMLVWRQ